MVQNETKCLFEETCWKGRKRTGLPQLLDHTHSTTYKVIQETDAKTQLSIIILLCARQAAQCLCTQ